MQDDISLRISRTGSHIDRRSTGKQSLQSSLTSEAIKGSVGFVHDSLSEDLFIPSASHLFSLSAMGSPGDLTSGEKNTIETLEQKQIVAGTSEQIENDFIEKSGEGFDQVISDGVGKLLGALKRPSPDDIDEYDMDKTIVKDEQLQQKFPTVAAAFAEPIPSFPVAGPSHLPASSAPQRYHESQEHQPTEHNIAHSFGSENQLTVIPGQNPFIKNKSKPGTIERLEELFIEPENLRTPQSASFETVEVGSSESVRQTASTTGEIDVFKHLFDDDENSVENDSSHQD